MMKRFGKIESSYKLRELENFHIILWLLKDLSWLMHWKRLGIFMIIPTIGFAIFITFYTRKNQSEFLNNLAIVFWISANSFWMLTEFFDLENQLKIFATIPFGIGIAIILYRYAKKLFTNCNLD